MMTLLQALGEDSERVRLEFLKPVDYGAFKTLVAERYYKTEEAHHALVHNPVILPFSYHVRTPRHDKIIDYLCDTTNDYFLIYGARYIVHSKAMLIVDFLGQHTDAMIDFKLRFG
jgi:hypothetical protein